MLTETDRLAIVRSIAQRCIAAERMNQWAWFIAPERRARSISGVVDIAVQGIDAPEARDVALSVACSAFAAVDGLVAAQNAGMAGDAAAAERAVGIRLGLAELATAGL